MIKELKIEREKEPQTQNNIDREGRLRQTNAKTHTKTIIFITFPEPFHWYLFHYVGFISMIRMELTKKTIIARTHDWCITSGAAITTDAVIIIKSTKTTSQKIPSDKL